MRLNALRSHALERLGESIQPGLYRSDETTLRLFFAVLFVLVLGMACHVDSGFLMRRPLTARKGKRSGDIRKDLSETQLAGIGSIALAYNEAEVLIDILVSLVLGLLTNTAHEVTSRINGIDGKIELAKIGMRELGADENTIALLGQSLGDAGFKEYKKYRDAVVHARVLDAPTGIALSPAKRGKLDEVLLTVDALNGLYDRLALVRLELIEACNIAIRLFSERRWAPIRAAAAMLPSKTVTKFDRLRH